MTKHKQIKGMLVLLGAMSIGILFATEGSLIWTLVGGITILVCFVIVGLIWGNTPKEEE